MMKILQFSGFFLLGFFQDNTDFCKNSVNVLVFKNKTYEQLKNNPNQGLVDILGPIVCKGEEINKDCVIVLKDKLSERIKDAKNSVLLSEDDKVKLYDVIEKGVEYWDNEESKENFSKDLISFTTKELEAKGSEESKIWKCVQLDFDTGTIILNGVYKKCSKEKNDL